MGRVLHIVPLAGQALAILHELKPLTRHRTWLVAGNRTNDEPMSENTINAVLRRLGYSRAQLTAHSFRSMASTMLHELGWPSDVIERQRAHAERNTVKAAHNRTRRPTAQALRCTAIGVSRSEDAEPSMPSGIECRSR